MTDQTLELNDLQERVRGRYADAALAASSAASERQAAGTVAAAGCCGETHASGGCCGETSAGSCCGPTLSAFGLELYDAGTRQGLPDAAVLASLGCGNPIAVAELREGETVLDLGSGGGIDVLLSARRVGPTGFAYGVDMTDEMLQLARANAEKAGATNVRFLKGTIEDIPL